MSFFYLYTLHRYAIFRLSLATDNIVTVTQLMIGGPAEKLFQDKHMNFPSCELICFILRNS
jgi:hypothetical protein